MPAPIAGRCHRRPAPLQGDGVHDGHHLAILIGAGQMLAHRSPHALDLRAVARVRGPLEELPDFLVGFRAQSSLIIASI
jgi:hypothetical protein